MRTICLAVITILSISVAACASTAKTNVTAAAALRPQVQPLIAKFSNACLVKSDEYDGAIVQESAVGAALLTALIPKAAGAAIDYVGGALQNAGADKKSTMQATAGPYMIQINRWDPSLAGRTLDLLPRARCLHLLAFNDSESKDWALLVEGTDRLPADIQTVRESLDMQELPAPTFYLELAVVLSADQSAFRLLPTFLRYRQAFSGRHREAELLSAVSISRPGVEKPFASTTLLLRGLRIGQTYDLGELTGAGSDWMPLDKPSEAAAEAKGRPHDPTTVEQVLRFDPLNVKVVLTETQDGIKLLKTLGELVSGAKESVTTAVTAALPNAEKAAAAEATRLDERNAYLNAMAAVAVKQAELDAKSDGVEKAKAQAELTKARLEANKAALKAGMTLPFGELYNRPS